MRRLLIGVALFSAHMVGCHASPNDPAGQAKELSDPVRRENAVANLTRIYTDALSKAKGDRKQVDVSKVVEASVDKLAQAVVANPDDHANNLKILDLLLEMRDKRALKAWLPSLNWRQEVSEEHAIRAAKGISAVIAANGDKSPFAGAESTSIVGALKASLERVNGNKPVENRLRIELIQTLGALKDLAATEVLADVARSQSASQSFLINRLAMEQLSMLRDPKAVPTLIRGLFLFDANNPANRMNDVAALGLAMLSKVATPQVLALLNGEAPEEIKALVRSYIQAVRARSPDAASGMDVTSLVTAEATYALGQMAATEAIPTLLKRAESTSAKTRLAAVLAVASMPLHDKDRSAFRSAFAKVYEKSEKTQRPQLLAAAQHVFDREMVPFFIAQSGPGEEEFPLIRVAAARAGAALASKAEAAQLRKLIADEPGPEEGGFRKTFEENVPALETATLCDADVACYRAKLSDARPAVIRKAASMMTALLSQPTPEDMAALVKALQKDDELTRADILYAVDRVAHRSTSSAVHGQAKDAITRLQAAEQGKASWTRLRALALTTLGHLEVK